MLSWDFIIKRIKDELTYPFQALEKSDDDIIDYLQRNALKKFERYFPDRARMTLNCSDPAVIVPDKCSEFYLFDPQQRQIKNVIGFISQMGDLVILGHPFMGVWSFEQTEEWALSTFKARFAKSMSNWNYTTEFTAPNILRISPKYEGTAVIEYEREHDIQLSTIIPDLEDIFVDLCVAMVEMWIGKIRQKFSTYNTPFGEIQVNGDMIYNDGKDLYDKTIEKLETGSLPNIIVDVG